MLTLLRILTLRSWRQRLSARKVRNEIETLKRWSRRSADNRYPRDD